MLNHFEHKKPNIILIITDQQRHDAVGYIDQRVLTPNINQLARSSIVCTNAFVQSPQCQPSRASILTGRYPTAHRVWWNGIGLPRSEKTIANYLKNKGYSTGYFGKMHINGEGTHTDVARYFGFDNTFLSEDWQSMAMGKLLNNKKPVGNKISEEFYEPMNSKTWTGKFSDRTMHHEDVITEQAINFIRSQAGPYFVVVGYNGPHPPYAAPEEFSSLYSQHTFSIPSVKIQNFMGHTLTDDEWFELKKQYYGSISWIDDNIGKLLKTDNSAIVIFTSDHGDILGDHGLFSKGVFTYDGNIRVPLLFKFPNVKRGKYEHIVQSIDILPTLLDYLEIPVPRAVQGKQLLYHLFRNNDINNYTMSMLCHLNRLRMIRTKEYKYWIHGNTEYLYNLFLDKEESNNICNHDEKLLNRARLDMLKALILCEDPLPIPIS